MSKIVDKHGAPMKALTVTDAADWGDRPLPRPAYTGGGQGQGMAGFNPTVTSADAALLKSREKMSARAHDLVRNDGWAKTGIDRFVDQVIGPGLRLKARPDYRALRAFSSGFDISWQKEFAHAMEGHWRIFAKDVDFHCDYARTMDMGGLQRLLFRSYAIDNECFGILRWRENGRTPYRTCIDVIDTDRVSNPMGQPESEKLRGGVEFRTYTDDQGHTHATPEPVAYHIRRTHPGDTYTISSDRFTWVRVPRETDWGRRIMLHGFEPERPGQSRGASRFAPIIAKLRGLGVYDDHEIKSAIVNSMFPAFIKSPFGGEDAMGMLQSGGINSYQKDRLQFHADNPVMMENVIIPQLYPNEELVFPQKGHPNTVYEQFERQALRGIAGALGLSYEQLSSDWSQVNYSSARAALLEIWKGIATVKARFETYVMNQIYAALVEEVMDAGLVPLPAGAPDFHAAKTAYCGTRWLGVAKGWVDPTKEAAGAQMRMDAMLSTLEDEAAVQGLDAEEVMDQRQLEIMEMKERNLPLPEWAAGVAAAAVMPAPVAAPEQES